CCGCCHTKNPATSRRITSISSTRRASVKDLHTITIYILQPFDNGSRLVLTGITFVGRHHTCRRALRPDDIQSPKRSAMHSFKDRCQISFQTDENCLCFRVTETHVVFEQLWSIIRQHQTQEQNSFERETFLTSAGERRFDDLANNSICNTLI